MLNRRRGVGFLDDHAAPELRPVDRLDVAPGGGSDTRPSGSGWELFTLSTTTGARVSVRIPMPRGNLRPTTGSFRSDEEAGHQTQIESLQLTSESPSAATGALLRENTFVRSSAP